MYGTGSFNNFATTKTETKLGRLAMKIENEQA